MRTLGILGTSLLLTATLGMLPGARATAEPRGSGDDGWDVRVVDPDQSFRGLDAVNRNVAWVSGGSMTGGSGKVYRTVDGGTTWDDVTPPGTEGLSLRDVEARNARTAVVLSVGLGESSRIWRTTDGGTTWTETFRNTEETAFYNCLDFYPGGRRGLAVSDPVDGRFRIAATNDRGRTWRVLPDAEMPDSTGEANFSASGDCLVIAGRTAWFGSGGTSARVFRSTDRGHTWHVSDSTLPPGDAAGVFALAFRTPRHGVAVGGDFAAPDDGTDASAYTRTGRAWTPGGDLTHLAEDAAWRRGAVLAVGEGADDQGTVFGGTSLSTDGGRTWRLVSEERFHTLDCTPQRVCWAAGAGGRVGRW
ncbi:oxidoreductase [Nocardioides sp.]|uniref:oxidoreductase n=1 Tax=Nocardioides sp. TaxID=35761 RepID=UPI002ED41735